MLEQAPTGNGEHGLHLSLHEIPSPALTAVEAQRHGGALFALRCARVTMLGVTVKCGNRTRWRCPRAALSRFRGMQLLGSCRPGARRLHCGYRLVLALILGQFHRPVRRLDLCVELALLACE